MPDVEGVLEGRTLPNVVTILVLAAALSGSAFGQKEFPAKAPSREATPSTPYEAVTKSGLKYLWWLPENLEKKKPLGITIICHGTGGDRRWGAWNQKPKVFRPDDVVLSLDGPSPGQGESRLFLAEKDDLEQVAETIAEAKKAFQADRVFLYGHSQGGFFVALFAGRYPTLVDGFCSHASGFWTETDLAGLKGLPVALMHGSRDPVVPYRQSVGSRDHAFENGVKSILLRRVEFYNHWPNAVRANEALDWCEGLSTKEPRRALELARRIVAAKPADEYSFSAAPPFGAARDILRRFEAAPARPFPKPDAAIAGEAKALAQKIEAEVKRHVEALKKSVGKKADLVLGEKNYLGHLAALREDARGVDAAEAYFKAIDFDTVAKQHAKTAGKLLEQWYASGEKDPLGFARAFGAEISNCFLFEGFPPETYEAMRKAADDPALTKSKKDEAAALSIRRWHTGWSEGAKAYRNLWNDWH